MLEVGTRWCYVRSCYNAARSDESECWQGSSGLDLVVVLFAL